MEEALCQIFAEDQSPNNEELLQYPQERQRMDARQQEEESSATAMEMEDTGETHDSIDLLLTD